MDKYEEWAREFMGKPSTDYEEACSYMAEFPEYVAAMRFCAAKLREERCAACELREICDHEKTYAPECQGWMRRRIVEKE